MSEDKKLGILKVAKELNIGIGTIAEFLDTKGFKIEAKPNTKLTDEMYSALLKEYQGDKILKEEAKNIVIGKIRRDDAPHHQTQQPAQSEKKEAEKEDKEILIKNATAEDLPKEEVSVKEVAEPEIKKDEPTAPHTGVKIVGKIDLDSLNSKTRPDKKQHKEEEKKK